MALDSHRHLTESSGDQTSTLLTDRHENSPSFREKYLSSSPLGVLNKNLDKDGDRSLLKACADEKDRIALKSEFESSLERKRVINIIKKRTEESGNKLLNQEDNDAYIKRIKNILNQKTPASQSRSYSPSISPKSTEKSSPYTYWPKKINGGSISSARELDFESRLNFIRHSNLDDCIYQNLPVKPRTSNIKTPTRNTECLIPHSPISNSKTKTTATLRSPGQKQPMKSKIGLFIDSLLNKENYINSKQASPVLRKTTPHSAPQGSKAAKLQGTSSKAMVKTKYQPISEGIVADVPIGQIQQKSDESLLYYIVEGLTDHSFFDAYSKVSSAIQSLGDEPMISGHGGNNLIEQYIECCSKDIVQNFEVGKCELGLHC